MSKFLSFSKVAINIKHISPIVRNDDKFIILLTKQSKRLYDEDFIIHKNCNPEDFKKIKIWLDSFDTRFNRWWNS